MAVEFNKTSYPGSIDPFWRKEAKMLPGGFSMKQTFNAGDIIRKGSFVAVDVDKMEAAIVKVGKVLDGSTESQIRVSKKNNFCKGDTIMKIGNESTTTVKSVDRSNPNYDIIEVDTAISGIVKEDFLQEADSSTKAPKYVANAVLGADLEIKASGLPTIDAAYDAIVLKSVCTPFPASWLVDNGFCLKANPNILIINQ